MQMSKLQLKLIYSWWLLHGREANWNPGLGLWQVHEGEKIRAYQDTKDKQPNSMKEDLWKWPHSSDDWIWITSGWHAIWKITHSRVMWNIDMAEDCHNTSHDNRTNNKTELWYFWDNLTFLSVVGSRWSRIRKSSTELTFALLKRLWNGPFLPMFFNRHTSSSIDGG